MPRDAMLASETKPKQNKKQETTELILTTTLVYTMRDAIRRDAPRCSFCKETKPKQKEEKEKTQFCTMRDSMDARFPKQNKTKTNNIK